MPAAHILLALLALPTLRQGSEPDFERDIRPLLEARCFSCHGAERQKSSLRLDRPELVLRGGDSGTPALVPGDADGSLIVQLVSGADPDRFMPPKGAPLTNEEIERLRRWIKSGASWGDVAPTTDTAHWSLRPLVRPTLPDETHTGWEHPIDRFVWARLAAAGLSASPEASRATLARRMTQILWGLPPAPEDVRAFVADTSHDAYERYTDRLLASPRYGERWARHWLDLARFAETSGFETNSPRPNAWHYRDYVIGAFNDDTPFDRFVLEQLAGDAFGQDAATGFLVAGANDTVLSPDVQLTRQQRQDELADMVNATSTAFMGMTVACARCHDHKFDPVTQADFYALQAVFAGVRHGERPLRTVQDEARQRALDEAEREITALRRALDELPDASGSPPAHWALRIDDEAAVGVSVLRERAGHGVIASGAGRGQAGDRGDLTRVPHLGGGRYSWWSDAREEDLISYRPGVAGAHQVWVSWGAGWDTHATDARWYLDVDGDLATMSDRVLLATVDQRQLADGARSGANEPRWSGLLDVGEHTLAPKSVIVLRAGSEGRPTTADAVVLQRATTEDSALPALRAGVQATLNEETFAPVLAARLRFRVARTNSGTEPCLDELEVYADGANLASRATLTTSGDYAGDPKHKREHLTDGRTGNDHSWISDTPGTGWVELEFDRPERVDRVVWGRDRGGAFADRLATEYVIEVATPRASGDVSEASPTWVQVASSSDRLPAGLARRDVAAYRFAGLDSEQRARAGSALERIRALEQELQEIERLPNVYAGRFEEPAPTHRLYRGDPMAEREVVAPDIPQVFGSLALAVDAPEQERRVALARWLCDRSNPLTARVIVNRIWMHHFGEGLVDTPSDFGVMGSEPSHPELLDWLAVELIESGWSLKHIQRLIVRSRTWRQASSPDSAGLAKDASARLLWRFPPRRLEAEYLRDAILTVAGTLDREAGGPGFSVFEPNDNYVRVYTPKDELGPDTWRRMIFMTKVRMERDATFGVFDTPDAGQVCPERARSTTALQALNLLNSTFVVQQAQRFAERLEREVGDEPTLWIERAFELAFGRTPELDESAAAVELVRDHGLPALCRVLFNANELVFVQ